MAEGARLARLLILGGTAEAVALSRAAAANPGLDVLSSLAGRTRTPRRPAGRLRVGGFGGAEGLTAFLEAERIDVVIDATHPFAVRISRAAGDACAGLGVPRLMLVRPPWAPVAGDRWIEVADAAAAAAAVPALGRTIFLSIGRTELAPFASLAGIRFVVRLVEAPAAPLPLRDARLILGRGPFAFESEQALFTAEGIDAVVGKNSGGTSTVAKIVAARALGLPVIMIRRPPPPAGETVETVDEAIAWLKGRLSRSGADGA